MHDLVIRRGLIVDGTGQAGFIGDVAIDGQAIAAVGESVGAGKREVDAEGLLVTPGFVDIHTHYDGQATWDAELAPSSWHGVTSVVMGNCGVGFAPAAPDKHDFLIGLMEGVEDIPGSALAEGLSWDWESFPQYLDALDSRPHTIDVGCLVPHAALRAYVMGERGADSQSDPTPDEIGLMAKFTAEALLCGAMGFASSRTAVHRTRDGVTIGSLSASSEELLGIGHALRDTGRGVFQFVSDWQDVDYEFGLMRRLSSECGRPLSFSLGQSHRTPTAWRGLLDMVRAAASEGVDIKAQVAPRPIGLLLGLQTSMHPFMQTPTYLEIALLPLKDRVERMGQPEVRAQMIAEYGQPTTAVPLVARVINSVDRLFPLGDPPNYEPSPEESVSALARAQGVEPIEVVYDLMLANGGTEMLYAPIANYADYSLDSSREMLLDDRTLFGLSDGGAHVGVICDASFPTYALTHWCRDRSGERLPLEFVVKKQTADTARHMGWFDRGVIAPGYKADINVIDFESLGLHRPEVVHDLPAGGRRLLQRADGYAYTICSGEVTFEDGKPTGATPGRLVRGAQSRRG